MNRPSRKVSGFTLIELMLVVAIIGILSAIVIPKIATLMAAAQCSQTKGNLGQLRTALSIYYSDMEGQYPYDNLASLTTNAKYLRTIPSVVLPAIPGGYSPGHGTYNFVLVPFFLNILLADQGGWGYQNSPAGTISVLDGTTFVEWGYLCINCLHKDTKGQFWVTL